MSSSISKQSLTELLAFPLIGGGILTLFDVMYEHKTWDKGIYDGMLMGGSLLVSKTVDDILAVKLMDEIGNEKAKNISQWVLEPAINWLLYGYLYESMYKTKFNGITNNRTKNMTSILGIGLGAGQVISDKYFNLATLISGVIPL